MNWQNLSNEPTSKLIEYRSALTGWSPFSQKDNVQRRVDAARLEAIKKVLAKRGAA